MEVEILVSDTDTGPRGIFEGGRFGSKITKKSVADLSVTFRDFCREFSEGLEAPGQLANKCRLEQIEMSVDVTIKGEVRIIASAGTRGSIKLVFSRSA
jgi:hypothetical protein